MKLYTLRWLTAAGLLLGLGACKKDFLDINTDPNNPPSADISLVLPSGQANVSFVVGGQYNILGGILAQHMGAGTAQFLNYDQYNITSNTLDSRQFQALYAGALQDYEYVIQEGTKNGEFRMVGIAKILKAHTYQILTDLYGDLPFSEALQPELTTTPIYDRQQAIYAGLHALLIDGVKDIRRQQGRFPGAADLNYKASSTIDMDRWIRLANTLQLKLYIRTSQVDEAGSKKGVEELITSMAATGSTFMRAGEDLQFANGVVANSENPFYQANFQLPASLVASQTFVQFFIDIPFDPRFRAYFVDNDLQNTGQFGHIFRIYGKAPGANINDVWSYPGTYFIGQHFNLNGRPGSSFPGVIATDEPAKARPTLLLTYEESLFLRAEAAVRGWSTENAQMRYNEGVLASMGRYGVIPSFSSFYLSRPEISLNGISTEGRIARIARQKWMALYGTNGIEAWIEARRTDGYRTNGRPGIPLELPQVNAQGRSFVKRLPYPDSELQRNPNVAATGLVPGDVTTPVWWDVP
ncbi:SusD/RagB family nutrient-binding outer membrane lipoprotein [Hymenobacter terrenus]|uniref:SusD/RagB family nutrient-binding outer membrane lipoprotein n=1 Tax=Hymenobacter terrenus TaxID=1629124 RepID=UPI0006198362|nr:SusD/RagB family nutrient-binding outer membrane lipoprotein [Hymenobacter terrenus]